LSEYFQTRTKSDCLDLACHHTILPNAEDLLLARWKEVNHQGLYFPNLDLPPTKENKNNLASALEFSWTSSSGIRTDDKSITSHCHDDSLRRSINDCFVDWPTNART